MSNIEAEQLVDELKKIIEENNQFLKDIDKDINEADSRYTQMEIQDKIAYLKMAKKSLEKAAPDGLNRQAN